MTVSTTLELDTATAANIAKQVTPLADRVVLVPLQETNTSAGGIVLSATTKEGSGKGQIVSVGPGKTNENGQPVPMTVQAGQTVYYSKYAGTEININGVQACILKAEDILAIENTQ